MKFEIVNKEDIPDDLYPGTYLTQVLSCEFVGKDIVVRIKFLGTKCQRFDCLFPLIKK